MRGWGGVFQSLWIRMIVGSSSSQLITSFHSCFFAQLCPTLWDPLDYSPPGSSVHGIPQARILEEVAIFFSRGSSWPRDQTHISCISCIAGRFLTHWAVGEAQFESSGVEWWHSGCVRALGLKWLCNFSVLLYRVFIVLFLFYLSIYLSALSLSCSTQTL